MLRETLAVGALLSGVWGWAGPGWATEFLLKNREDKVTLEFQPKSAGKVTLTGKWEGAAKSLDVALYGPTQLFAHYRGVVTKNPFDLSWDFSEKEIGESDRPWKVVLKAKGGEAKGTAEIGGEGIAAAKPADKAEMPGSAGADAVEDDLPKPAPEEAPPIPLDDFGVRVRRAFVETPFYKPWVEKLSAGKKTPKLDLRPLGLTVTPAIRKIQTRYGQLSLTVRRITLTPGQNVNLMESISGSVETTLELLIRVEVPGWHLVALQVSPFTAYPGEPPRLTSMQVDLRSLSRGEILPATSFPLSGADSLLLIPTILSHPGEYLFTARPIAREQAEILFILAGVELYRLSS